MQRQTLRSSSTKSIRRERPREVKLVNHVPPAGAAEESETRQPRPRCGWSNLSTGSLLLDSRRRRQLSAGSTRVGDRTSVVLADPGCPDLLWVADISRSPGPAGPLVSRLPQVAGALAGEVSSVVRSTRGALALQAHDLLRPSQPRADHLEARCSSLSRRTFGCSTSWRFLPVPARRLARGLCDDLRSSRLRGGLAGAHL